MEHGGDEERALTALSDLDGWGAYEDEVHSPDRRKWNSAKRQERERLRKREAARKRREVGA
jgi:hypothetical protein